MLHNRYIVLETTFQVYLLFLHCIYVFVHHNDRPTFFKDLPTHFSADAQHIMGGNFNRPVDPVLDQVYEADRCHHHGREQLLQ